MQLVGCTIYVSILLLQLVFVTPVASSPSIIFHLWLNNGSDSIIHSVDAFHSGRQVLSGVFVSSSEILSSAVCCSYCLGYIFVAGDSKSVLTHQCCQYLIKILAFAYDVIYEHSQSQWEHNLWLQLGHCYKLKKPSGIRPASFQFISN